ncbi:hypothetical protein A8L34_13100 [Bacillus sp. FJAT-27264]|uniref:hypothetical protein n=1 Tax=Paenibacillus sp. (strain DSM 101736 / FJAT-27264) TaxID=1850362 RepID=UPI000807B3E2|nr:hypothetical protein [Bacillus sp. FJAT-27264]OBZ14827.1 hypothetical protein A8L34_13100 [Bacillus sp. FJAT-27264]
MDGWLAAVLVTGIGVLATAALLLTVSVMKTLAALRETVSRLELAGTSLAAETAETLQRTAAAAENAEARLREMEPLASGLACVGESLGEAGGQLKTLSRKTAASVNHALERARERNEPGLEHALRALDAGLTLWTAWNKRK